MRILLLHVELSIRGILRGFGLRNQEIWQFQHFPRTSLLVASCNARRRLGGR